LISFVSASSSL